MAGRIYKRHCDYCDEYYEGQGAKYCCPEHGYAARRKESRDPAPPSSEAEILEDLRDYQLIDGNFLFVIDGRLLTVEFERWNEICRDYSEHGADLTQAELARKHGIQLPILKRILRSYGQYKASPPAAREKISDHKDDLTPLIDEAIENDEARFLNALNRKRDEEWRADYLRLKRERLAEDRLIQAASDMMAGFTLSPPRLKTSKTSKPYRAIAITADEHVGKEVWHEEAFGVNLDTSISCQRIVEHARATAERIRDRGGRCEHLYRGLLGDYFHALFGQTDHGTKLDQDTRAAKVWRMGVQALIEACHILLEVSDTLEVLGAPGNHDRVEHYILRHALSLAFGGHERVRVRANPHYYEAFRVGETLHVLDHGYRVGSLSAFKAKAQAEVVAREVGGDLFHGARTIYSYYGHLHEESSGTQGRHHRLIRVESLGESDDFETSLRYAGDAGAHVYILDARGRIRSSENLFPDDLDPALRDAA